MELSDYHHLCFLFRKYVVIFRFRLNSDKKWPTHYVKAYMLLGPLAITDLYTWNCSLWFTRWGQRNGCFVWGSFLRDILTEAEEKVAYRDFRISRHDLSLYMKLFFVSYSLRPKKRLFCLRQFSTWYPDWGWKKSCVSRF